MECTEWNVQWIMFPTLSDNVMIRDWELWNDYTLRIYYISNSESELDIWAGRITVRMQEMNQFKITTSACTEYGVLYY